MPSIFSSNTGGPPSISSPNTGGSALGEARREAGISLDDLAWRSGVPVEKIRRFEAGTGSLLTMHYEHVMRAFGILLSKVRP